MKTTRSVILGLVTLLALIGDIPTPVATVAAHDHDKSSAPPQVSAQLKTSRLRAGDSAGARAYFSDVVLLNQHGQPMRFYTDVLQGKVVVITSFFATCTGSCPLIMATYARMQDALGDRLGKDVHLVALSVDPLTDTPDRLKAYAEALRARPGWYFLTGKKENVDLALRKIGHVVPNKDAHLNILIIGNEPTGLWKKAFSLAPADELIRLVEGALNNR